ncbi:energy transducer TonB [Undibacterium flavidum]|uniref:Energy transducer TonB n=1 Tax=Undibacterium flavidum TaxID=2762297 RepID=A0ABR6YGN4_9BURK|nr:energy transducer TonB [Undibacterium flavidum]MBC3875731.1 energy transducer TonB [Undibacterium flavidum]
MLSIIFAVFVSNFANAAVVQPVMDTKSCDLPKYPKASLINEETGTVSMSLLIGVDGKVMESKVDASSGSKSLDKAALSAFAACKFKPGTKDGKAEQMWVKIDYVWKF